MIPRSDTPPEHPGDYQIRGNTFCRECDAVFVAGYDDDGECTMRPTCRCIAAWADECAAAGWAPDDAWEFYTEGA